MNGSQPAIQFYPEACWPSTLYVAKSKLDVAKLKIHTTVAMRQNEGYTGRETFSFDKIDSRRRASIVLASVLRLLHTRAGYCVGHTWLQDEAGKQSRIQPLEV